MLPFLGCAAKPLEPKDNRILNPFSVGCTCTGLTDAELNHFSLVGDKRMDAMLKQLGLCVERGWLEEVK